MDGLKQRIIGALVLVCLAVIFVPMIFDEPHPERQSMPITIPEEPPFPEVEMIEEPAPETEGYGLSTQPAVPPAEGGAEDDPGFRLIEEAEEVGAAPASEPVQTASEPAPALNEQSVAADSEPAVTEKDVDEAEFSRSLQGAWIVQLGSFGNEDNARGLRDKVVELGYGAHLQRVSRGDTQFTRVFSGPFADKSDAESAKRQLDQAFDLNSLVTTGNK